MRYALRCILLMILLAPLVTSLRQPACAESVAWIRDAEIEDGLIAMAKDIFRVAGLDGQALRIIIVHSDEMNASVLPGGTILVNTGLLLRLTSPEQLLGVIAHEAGHLRGGHHLRRWETMQRSAMTYAAGLLLSGLAALGGAPQLAMAAAQGGVHVAERSYLSDSREKENSADQASIDLMAKLQLPPTGLAQALKILEENASITLVRADQYRVTHPFPADREAFFTAAEAHSPYRGRTLPETSHKWFKRSQAKLKAFLDPLSTSNGHQSGAYEKLATERANAHALASQYYQAIMAHRQAKPDHALDIIEKLIKIEPKNPYFYELKGQVLFENARTLEAISAYRHSIALHKNSPLLLSECAHALVEQDAAAAVNHAHGHSPYLAEAIRMLRKAQTLDPENPVTLQFLAVALGREGKMLQSILALVQKALSEGQDETAREQIRRAVQLYDKRKSSGLATDEQQAYLKIQDIALSIESSPQRNL